MRNYTGLSGTLLVVAGVFSPMLRIPIIGNWNYFDIDTALASIVLTLAVLGILASVMNKSGLLRFSGWAALIVVVFTLAAVYFKVNDYFAFIPFKKMAAAAVRIIHYQWIGWGLLAAGSVLMIIGGRKRPLEVKNP